MVQYLLGLLEGRLEALENPAMTKGQIVKALKAMSRSLLHGSRVTAILEKSTVWSEYKDQRHDLFISNTPTAGYLTGNSWCSGGLLFRQFVDRAVRIPCHSNI
jgi:DnaJ family protein C protein 13